MTIQKKVKEQIKRKNLIKKQSIKTLWNSHIKRHERYEDKYRENIDCLIDILELSIEKDKEKQN